MVCIVMYYYYYSAVGYYHALLPQGILANVILPSSQVNVYNENTLPSKYFKHTI